VLLNLPILQVEIFHWEKFCRDFGIARQLDGQELFPFWDFDMD
jgi:hypothetical protein